MKPPHIAILVASMALAVAPVTAQAQNLPVESFTVANPVPTGPPLISTVPDIGPPPILDTSAAAALGSPPAMESVDIGPPPEDTYVVSASTEIRPYESTFNGRHVSLARSGNELRLADHERIAMMGTAVAGCDLYEIVGKEDSDVRYVSAPEFEAANPDLFIEDDSGNKMMAFSRPPVGPLHYVKITEDGELDAS